MSTSNFYLLQFVLKLHTFGKSDKDKSFERGGEAKATNDFNCCLRHYQNFLQKPPKVVNWFFANFWDVIFYPLGLLLLQNKLTI